MAAITKTRKLEKRPKTKKFPFSRPGTKLYPTNSKRVYSRTVTLFSICKVLYQFSFRFSSRFRDLDQSKIFPTNFFFMFFRSACHDSWTQLRLSPMFGCICPNNHMKRRCDRIFSTVNHNPCVGKYEICKPIFSNIFIYIYLYVYLCVYIIRRYI